MTRPTAASARQLEKTLVFTPPSPWTSAEAELSEDEEKKDRREGGDLSEERQEGKGTSETRKTGVCPTGL